MYFSSPGSRSLTRRLKDAIELVLVGIGFVATLAIIKVYTVINARRDELVKELEENGVSYSVHELREMGDRAPDFRYTL